MFNSTRFGKGANVKKTIQAENVCCFYIRNFPRTLRQHFAAMCALAGKTMKERLTEIVRDDVKRYHESKNKGA